MKKLLLIGFILVLVGCSSETKLNTGNEYKYNEGTYKYLAEDVVRIYKDSEDMSVAKLIEYRDFCKNETQRILKESENLKKMYNLCISQRNDLINDK